MYKTAKHLVLQITHAKHISHENIYNFSGKFLSM